MEKERLSKLSEAVKGEVSQQGRSTIISVAPATVKEVCKLIAAIPGFYHLSTITGVDEGDGISVFYHFWKGRDFISVKTKVSYSDPKILSSVEYLPAALLYEAEIKDLLGVTFEGNPLMGSRLLLPDTYPPQAPPPLRKTANPEEIRKSMQL